MSKRKEPPREGNLNQEFCDYLAEIADYERNVNKNMFKYKAYRKAASAIARHPTRITSGKEALKLDGVGKKISEKLEEFIQTGELTKLKKIRTDDTAVAINELSRVSGIGPSKARQLVELGVKSIEELREHADKLNHHQQIGLKYLEDFEQKIPRCEIEQIESVLREVISKLDGKYEITICGSYRRGKSESGDIDALIRHPDFTSDKKVGASLLRRVVEALTQNGLVVESLALGDVKFMGACKMAERVRRLDLRLTPYDQYYCSVLYFTGSDLFNQQMRAHAQSVDFTLNEYCLRRVGSTGIPGDALPISSEEEIFEKFKRDIDVIRENHKFLWDDEEPRSWEEQLAKKYYDRLYKEYCIADLSRYKEGKVALRWQIEAELVTGKGQFVCGQKNCNEKDSLKTWEVNFGYVEAGEKKNALVKLRLCAECSDKLNYKHQRRELKRRKKRKYTEDLPTDECASATSPSEISPLDEPSKKTKQEEASTPEADRETSPRATATPAAEDDGNVWKTANRVVEEKSRDDDFEEFLEQLLF